MREQAEGVDVNTRRGRPTAHHRKAITEWLRDKFSDLPPWRRDMILSRIEEVAQDYHEKGRVYKYKFEELYEPQQVKRTLIKKTR